MKLALSFIRSFLPVALSPEEIAETLTLLGIEVDHIEHPRPSFAKVVCAQILSCQKHPDAASLQIAAISDGEKVYQVVCGAPNCRPNLRVAFAREGAVLNDADGVQRRIEKTKIRGFFSEGMLCSSLELGLSRDNEGILELPEEIAVGADLSSILWDPVLELSLTPNLGHCMSALGIARELSAALKIPLVQESLKKNGAKLSHFRVQTDPAVCLRYTCCLIEDVTVMPSFFFTQKTLEACGQKAINHVVDATNWIRLKRGQPLHAFDADLLEGNYLEIKRAPEDFLFLGLDGVERKVSAGIPVIYDAKKAVAIAGIIGGANSAVSPKTRRVLLEAAHFNPIEIRKAAKALSLRTESAQTFEKEVDPQGLEGALFDAAELIGGTVCGSLDVSHQSFKPRVIAYRVERINSLLGTKLSETEVEEIFKRLHFKAKHSKAEIPLFRTDLHEEIDLIEEVAKIYGYNNIEKKPPKVTLSSQKNHPLFTYENKLREHLSSSGFFECLHCDLISPKLADICHMITPKLMGFLKTSYSKSEEYSILRTSLMPSLLQTVKRNLSQKAKSIPLFEIGTIHFTQEEELLEIPMLALLLSGQKKAPYWDEEKSDFDYFDLKGVVESFVSARFVPSSHIALHPGRQADILLEQKPIGSLGEIHPKILHAFDIDQKVYYAEINLLDLMGQKIASQHVAPLPQFPSSERDWTIALPLDTLIEEVFDAIEKSPTLFLAKKTLIDLYIPENENQKHATFRFVYRDPLKTLLFEEVEKEHERLTQSILKLLAK